MSTSSSPAVSICDQAIEILAGTRDGDDLTPAHLYLVQEAVNGHLNDKGLAAFAELLATVQAGYVKPYLHGIEHLTRNHAGYVFWKGISVEHYDGRYAASERGQAAAVELARRCRILEARGEEVNFAALYVSWREIPSQTN